MPARKKLSLSLGRAFKASRGKGRGFVRRQLHVHVSEDNFPGTYEIEADDDDRDIERAVRAIGRFHSEKVKRTKDFASKHERRGIANVAGREIVCSDLAIIPKSGAVEVFLHAATLDPDPGVMPKLVQKVKLVFRDIADVPPNNELMAILADRVNAAAATEEVDETDRAQRERSLKALLEVDE